MSPKIDQRTPRCINFQVSLFFSQSVILNPSNDVAAFMGFVCHFFGIGAVQNPIKHTFVAETVPEHIFNMLFHKSHQKTLQKGLLLSHGFCHFGTILKHRPLFTPFLQKWRQRHQKGHLNATIFGLFVWKLIQRLQKGWLNGPPELPEWLSHGSAYFSKHGGGIMRSTGYILIWSN